MSFDTSRLRRGEWIAGAGALVLFVSLFLIKWYSADLDLGGDLAAAVAVNGWHGHSVLRWLVLLTIVAGAALWFLTATQRTDAVPLTAAVGTTIVAGITTVALAYRVVLDEPGPNALIELRAGAYVGLASAAAVLAGAWLSLRDEGETSVGAPVEVRRVRDAQPGDDETPAPPPPPAA